MSAQGILEKLGERLYARRVEQALAELERGECSLAYGSRPTAKVAICFN